LTNHSNKKGREKMTHRIKDIIDHSVWANDQRCPVREVFFDPEDHTLRYLALDLGGWFAVDEVLVAAHLLHAPTSTDTHWRVPLDGDALDSAPRWTDDTDAGQIDLQSWPPIFIGPFGGTYSPILLYEQAVDRSSARAHGSEDAPPGDRLVYRLQRVTEWLALPVFGTDGELGTVTDLVFDKANRRITALEITRGSLLDRQKYRVPMTAVRHRVDQGTHVVADIVVDDLQPAPDH